MSHLAGVWIKIDRAKHHLECLERAISDYTTGDPSEIFFDTEAQPGEKLYRFKFKRPIPVEWSSLIGDTIHNLRSALDMLATVLVIQGGKTSNSAIKETYFPIASTQQDFENLLVKRLHYATDAVRQFVRNLKPYKGGADTFYQLHQLDIVDKHTSLIPVGIGHGKVGMKYPLMFLARPGESENGHFARYPVIYSDFRSSLPLQDGDIIFSAPVVTAHLMIIGNGPQINLPLPPDPDLQFTFEIAFGKDQIMDGQAVIPTLKQFIDFIESVVRITQNKFFP